MEFRYQINPGLDVPLYTQLVDMFRADIRAGALPVGTRLPTVRELRDTLGIARGTVMRAYDEMEQQGLIEKIQGRGTFVCGEKSVDLSRKDRAMAAIDTMLDSLEALNFSQSEIGIYLELKLRERAAVRKNVRVAVVECNNEILSLISEQIRSLGDVDVYAYHLEEVQAYPYKLGEDIDLIVVSASHAEELRHLVPDQNRLAKAALRLMPPSVAELVRLPRGSRVAVLCQSTRFAELIASVCGDYTDGVTVLPPLLFGAFSGSDLAGLDALLVPPNFERFCGERDKALIASYARSHPLVSCEYRIDEGSLMYVEDRIRRIRDAK